jgi:hypothetical protein
MAGFGRGMHQCLKKLPPWPDAGFPWFPFLGTGGDIFLPNPTKKHKSKATHAGLMSSKHRPSFRRHLARVEAGT